MSTFLDSCYRAIRLQESSLAAILNRDLGQDLGVLSERPSIILTGCGDSYAVAQYGFWCFQSLGLRSLVLSPPEVERIALDDHWIVIGVTASGRSLATLQSLTTAKSKGALTIALTDAPEGAVSKVAEVIWHTDSHVESYDLSPSAPTTSAMAYLLNLAAHHPRVDTNIVRDTETLYERSKDVIAWAENRGNEIAETLQPLRPVYVISDGPNYVASQIGAMKLNEFSLFRGIAVLREEFKHHSVLSVRNGDQVVLVTDTPSKKEDAAYLGVLSGKLGMKTYQLFTPNEMEIRTPLVQSIPNTIAFQMMAYRAVLKHRPEMSAFRKPHATAFKIY